MNEETKILYLTLVGDFYIQLIIAAGITTDSKWLTAIQSPNSGTGAQTLLNLSEKMVSFMFGNVGEQLQIGGD